MYLKINIQYRKLILGSLHNVFRIDLLTSSPIVLDPVVPGCYILRGNFFPSLKTMQDFPRTYLKSSLDYRNLRMQVLHFEESTFKLQSHFCAINCTFKVVDLLKIN